VATVTFLGSSGAVPAAGHDNTYLVVEGDVSTVLVDCAGSPLQKLQLAGIDPLRLTHAIFTHSHPDHMYGYPILILGLLLIEHSRELTVIAGQDSIETARSLLGAFRPEKWPGFHEPRYVEVVPRGETLLADLPELLITCCPSEHLIPSMAVKFLSKASGGTVVYSSDTAPCEAVVRLARGCDVLVHESSGDTIGHSSASQAGQVAERAGAGKLFLVHYPAHRGQLGRLITEAQKEFTGPVDLARDFGAIEF
jgi:ribonuclease Z